MSSTSLLFDYGFASGAPFYRASLDPGGLFNAWDVTVVAVTALAVMFLFLHLDLWPLTRFGSVMRQPVLGIVWTLSCVVVAWALFWVGTRGFGMDAPVFLVRVPIPFIFGSVILLNMLQGSLFGGLRQPVKGLASALAAAGLCACTRIRVSAARTTSRNICLIEWSSVHAGGMTESANPGLNRQH